MRVYAVIEGDTDEPVIRKLADDAGLEVARVFDMGGKGPLDQRLKDFNNAAKGSPWVVLRDLDHDSGCAPTYVRKIRIRPVAQWLVFRLAVREMEAWLLADREGLANFMGLSVSKITNHPDDENDPTEVLVNLARQSTKKAVVSAFVPRPGDSISVGPGYEGAIIEFGKLYWNLSRASDRSPSLRSAREALRDLATRWQRHLGGGSSAQ